jgi:hypothetical protein
LTIYYTKCHYSYVFLVAYTNIWVTLKSLDGHTIRGIFKNRHLSNATGRIRDESLINQGGRAYTNIWVTLKSLDGHTIRGIFKNRHLSNATGRIRDESLINQGGRDIYYSGHGILATTDI